MKNSISLLVFAFFGTILFGQTTLEYNLNKGDTFLIKQQAQQIITQELDGAVHEITNKIDGVMEFKVIGEKDGHYEIDMTFKNLNLNMSSSIQGELLSVNAQEVTEGDMQSKIFNSLLNVPIHIILAKNGDILKVDGGDSLVSKMVHASGLKDDFSLNLMKKSLEKEFGSEALSNSYEQLTYIYPEGEINIGDTWENEYIGKLSAKNIWTLDNITSTNASISGKAVVVMDVTEPATTMKLRGTQDTSITTDIISGFIVLKVVEGTSEGISTITQMGDQEIPTTIKSTITYELINE